MKIAVTDKEFVDKRRKLVRLAPIVLSLCLLVIAGFGLWAYFFQPLMADPFEVARRIQEDALDATTVALMAVMLPIMMLVCMGLTAAVVGLAWAGLANERRYLGIIDSLTGESQNT